MIKNTLKAYLFDINSLNEESFNRLLLSVKNYRKEKIAKLSLQKSKYLSLAVELLIRKACEDFGIDYLKEEIVLNEFGKPSFKSSKYFFNTSHSGQYALCVISDVEVGCDIEEIKEYKPRVAERFFSDKENLYINVSEDKNDMFFRIWTLKESFMKCIGKGFAEPISSFELEFKDNDVVIREKDEFHFIESKYNNYRISICLKTKEKYDLPNISLIEFN